MKKLNKYVLLLLALVVFIPACKDEDLVILPEWETAVHGLGSVSEGSQSNFIFGDPSGLSFDLLWNSVDGDNTVTKIEIFVLFNEAYVDPDGNPKTAKHGGDSGLPLLTLEGSAVPANRVTTTFTVTQDQVYSLYSTASFDYDDDGTETPVWSNPDKPDRDTDGNKFISGDTFQLIWQFTTADGRVFDSWGISVCTEFPGANCSISWGVICVSDIAGTYTAVTSWTDYYGAGAGGAYYCSSCGNDGTIADGVRTSTVTLTEVANATYAIADLTNGFEPLVWGNPPVAAQIVDQCGRLVLNAGTFSYLYGYDVLPGSQVNDDGTITIIWTNVYGENGLTTLTPQ